MAQQVLEGTWEEVCRSAQQFAGHRVRLIVFTTDEPDAGAPILHPSEPPPSMLKRGMFPQLLELTDADFAAAEFRGDVDDGLDWS